MGRNGYFAIYDNYDFVIYMNAMLLFYKGVL